MVSSQKVKANVAVFWSTCLKEKFHGNKPINPNTILNLNNSLHWETQPCTNTPALVSLTTMEWWTLVTDLVRCKPQTNCSEDCMIWKDHSHFLKIFILLTLPTVSEYFNHFRPFLTSIFKKIKNKKINIKIKEWIRIVYIKLKRFLKCKVDVGAYFFQLRRASKIQLKTDSMYN